MFAGPRVRDILRGCASCMSMPTLTTLSSSPPDLLSSGDGSVGPTSQERFWFCTDGRSGHHARTRRRNRPGSARGQEASARVGQYSFELLKKPDGRPVRGSLPDPDHGSPRCAVAHPQLNRISPPPVARRSAGGVHPDHITVAEGRATGGLHDQRARPPSLTSTLSPTRRCPAS